MNIESFDKLSDKLFTKLNEEYDALTGDNPLDPKEALQKSLHDKAKKLETTTRDVYQKAQDSKNPKIKESLANIHAKKVIDRTDAENAIRKARLGGVLTESDLDAYSDADMYLIAEEFEFDLKEAAEPDPRMLRLDHDIDATEEKIKRDKEAAEQKLKAEQERNNDLLTQQKSSNKQTLDTSKEKLADLEQNQEKAIDAIKTTADNKTRENENKLEKLKNSKEVIMNMEKNSLVEGLFKTKEEKIDHKRDKISDKISKITVKIEGLKEKLKVAQYKHKGSDALRITNKINTLKTQIENLKNEYSVADDKKASYEFENLKEYLEFGMDYERMYGQLCKIEEEVDKLIAEEAEITTEEKEQIKQESPAKKYGCEEILSKPATGDIQERIVEQIRAELSKPEVNTKKLNALKLKYVQYRNR